MTDKIILSDVATFDNSIINVINANNDTLVTAIDNTLSRDGSSPNQMGSTLDMNSYPIINLPAPGSPNSPARLIDVTTANPITISLSLAGDVTSPASSGTLTTTVGKINGVALGTTTATSGNVLIADGTKWNTVAPSGAITINSTGVTSLSSNTVTLADMVPLAASSVIGNSTGSSATPTAVGATALTTLINPFSSSLSGSAPASGGGTTNFLRADGTWAVPAAAPSYQLVNTLTASSAANLTDTSSLTSTYSTYELVFENLVPAISGTVIQLQVHSGGAYKTTGYITAWVGSNNALSPTNVSSITTYIPLIYPAPTDPGSLINTAPGFCGKIRFHRPSVSQLCLITGEVYYLTVSEGISVAQLSGYWNTSGVVDGFKIVMSSGNIASGIVKVYGIL